MFYFYEDGHVTISMGILFKKELSTIRKPVHPVFELGPAYLSYYITIGSSIALMTFFSSDK